MIRLAYHQFRAQSAVAFAGLTAAAILLAITGHDLAHLYAVSGLATCKAHGDCAGLDSTFLTRYPKLRNLLGPTLLALPAVLGIFWGAPLVARELETGTYRLAWTQSVTRTRWLAVKIALVGGTSIAVVGLFSLMVTWWFRPIDKLNLNGSSPLGVNRFAPGVFSERDIVPLGYAAFAFAVGLTAGVLLRRTVPAMAVTLVAFIAARLAATYWLRPHLIPPAHVTAPLSAASHFGFRANNPGEPVTFVAGPPKIANAWVYSDQLVDRTGRLATTRAIEQFLHGSCPHIATAPPVPAGGAGATPAGGAAFQACITKLSARFHELVTYQPAGRFWTFQALETLLFLAAALLIAAACGWWIRRRDV